MSDVCQFTPLWGEWEIESIIGEGSFGKVYKAFRNDFGHKYYSAIKHISIPQSDVELKQLLDEQLSGDMGYATEYYKQIVTEINNEIIIMHSLRGNTNIVAYEDHMIKPQAKGVGYDIFIRMELLTELSTRVRAVGLSQAEVVKLGIDICRALEICAKHKLIHRDIKPQNVFINANGDYKLGDFGISRKIEQTSSGLSKKGTYSYMAPEVYRSDRYSENADIYSLGVLMYKLLNGNRLPFLPLEPQPIRFADGELALKRRMHGEQIPAPSLAEPTLAQIVLKMCAFDRKIRYQDAEEVRKELQNILADVGEDKETPATKGLELSGQKEKREIELKRKTTVGFTEYAANYDENTESYFSTSVYPEGGLEDDKTSVTERLDRVRNAVKNEKGKPLSTVYNENNGQEKIKGDLGKEKVENLIDQDNKAMLVVGVISIGVFLLIWLVVTMLNKHVGLNQYSDSTKMNISKTISEVGLLPQYGELPEYFFLTAPLKAEEQDDYLAKYGITKAFTDSGAIFTLWNMNDITYEMTVYSFKDVGHEGILIWYMDMSREDFEKLAEEFDKSFEDKKANLIREGADSWVFGDRFITLEYDEGYEAISILVSLYVNENAKVEESLSDGTVPSLNTAESEVGEEELHVAGVVVESKVIELGMGHQELIDLGLSDIYFYANGGEIFDSQLVVDNSKTSSASFGESGQLSISLQPDSGDLTWNIYEGRVWKIGHYRWSEYICEVSFPENISLLDTYDSVVERIGKPSYTSITGGGAGTICIWENLLENTDLLIEYDSDSGEFECVILYSNIKYQYPTNWF